MSEGLRGERLLQEAAESAAYTKGRVDDAVTAERQRIANNLEKLMNKMYEEKEEYGDLVADEIMRIWHPRYR